MENQKSQETELIERLLGRKPQGEYEVAVRREDGSPRVLKNAPFLDDGTPMPTLYWLVDPVDKRRISQLESSGAIGVAEAEIGLEEIELAHRKYQQERNSMIPEKYVGPIPSGGVGGTRVGIKCLHAHYAWFLAGGEDPVGNWVDQKLETEG